MKFKDLFEERGGLATFFMGVVPGCIVLALFPDVLKHNRADAYIFLACGIAQWMITLGILFLPLYFRPKYKEARWHLKKMRIEFKADQRRQTVEMDELNTNAKLLSQLVKGNQEFASKYYRQVYAQARWSYLLCAASTTIGFLVIVGGVVIALREDRWTGALTTGAGLLVDTISALMFYLYNKTAAKMSAYQKTILISTNVTLAMKCVSDLGEAKNKSQEQAYKSLIKCLTERVNDHLVGEQPNLVEKEEPSNATPLFKAPQMKIASGTAQASA